MALIVDKVTFPRHGENDGPDITARIFGNGIIPPVINDAYTNTITFHDILPDPFHRQRKDLVVEMTDSVTGEKIVKRFPEPSAEGSDRRIFIEIP